GGVLATGSGGGAGLAEQVVDAAVAAPRRIDRHGHTRHVRAVGAAVRGAGVGAGLARDSTDPGGLPELGDGDGDAAAGGVGLETGLAFGEVSGRVVADYEPVVEAALGVGTRPRARHRHDLAGVDVVFGAVAARPLPVEPVRADVRFGIAGDSGPAAHAFGENGLHINSSIAYTF